MSKPTVADLLKRVEALEAEVAALRAENVRPPFVPNFPPYFWPAPPTTPWIVWSSTDTRGAAA